MFWLRLELKEPVTVNAELGAGNARDAGRASHGYQDMIGLRKTHIDTVDQESSALGNMALTPHK